MAAIGPIAGILLAAGGSTRMGPGRPKQLLIYEGQTLLRRAAESALAAHFSPLIVVLGDDPGGVMRAELRAASIDEGHKPTRPAVDPNRTEDRSTAGPCRGVVASPMIIENPDWRSGMGSSIRRGMQGLALADPTVAATFSHPGGVALMVCDQPLVTAAMLRRLAAIFDGSSMALCAASYQETVGVPAIFGRGYFTDLGALPDAQGAKSLLRAGASHLKTLPLPEAAVDIDDAASYHNLVTRQTD